MKITPYLGIRFKASASADKTLELEGLIGSVENSSISIRLISASAISDITYSLTPQEFGEFLKIANEIGNRVDATVMSSIL